MRAKLYVKHNLPVSTYPKLDSRHYVEKYANVNVGSLSLAELLVVLRRGV